MLFKILLCIFSAVLAGCAGVGVEGANIAKDKVTISKNIDPAKRGDAKAQFKVGEALCCSPREETGRFYNTRTSIAWLCASARQGYAPAMHKIGKIYSGDVVDGVRLFRRAAMGIAGSSENLPVAYVWLRQAVDGGFKDEDDLATKVWRDLTAPQRQTATHLYQSGLKTKCLWDDVIGKGQ
ncbi:MAG: hypothetical protein ISR52_00795 [Rhodospirillales bacterium]|nr:hypothetical protein [Rhodospirillales bacterium]